jgi:hypothetical protein
MEGSVGDEGEEVHGPFGCHLWVYIKSSFIDFGKLNIISSWIFHKSY